MISAGGSIPTFKSFEALGATLHHNGKFELVADKRLHGQDILLLDEASVTATENGIMAAALAKGTTILRTRPANPMSRMSVVCWLQWVVRSKALPIH
ncbi:MAG: hypothetical protein R2867_21955 [Caldilineaceae bacterium]